MSETQFLSIKKTIDEIALRAGRDPQTITLVAVSKGHPQDLIDSAYKDGCREFGESRIQEALKKIAACPHDIQWHFIGTLQMNKVAKTIGRFVMIHSVDSLELAKKISQASLEKGTKTSVLLQLNTSGEKTKHGLKGSEWLSHLDELLALQGISIDGLMTIAPLVDDDEIIRSCFAELRKWRTTYQQQSSDQLFHHLSMGMSHDYKIAIEEGATILRIGTAIFGIQNC